MSIPTGIGEQGTYLGSLVEFVCHGRKEEYFAYLSRYQPKYGLLLIFLVAEANRRQSPKIMFFAVDHDDHVDHDKKYSARP